jgi:hypothetical protein
MSLRFQWTIALSLIIGSVVAPAQPQTSRLDAGETKPESNRQVALDSLLSSIEYLDLQKDEQGHVVSLALGSRNATDQNLSLVSTLSTLQELTIRGRGWPSNQWTLDGLAQLERMTNLSSLRIACLAVEPDKNLQFLYEVSRLHQLRSLYLVCASQKTAEYFALTNLQNLTTLLVSYDTNFGNAELSLLTNLPNLKRIDLYGAAVTPEGTNVLSQMPGLTNVTIRFRK